MDSKTAVLAMYEAINDRQLHRLDDVLASGAVMHLSHVPHPIGRDELKADLGGYLEAFPDLAINVEQVVGEGDRVAVRLVAHGTHHGAFGGVEPTGRRITVTETDFLRVSGGRVVEGWVLYDQFALLAQLGVLADLANA